MRISRQFLSTVLLIGMAIPVSAAPSVRYAPPTLLDRFVFTNQNLALDAQLNYRDNHSSVCFLPETGELMVLLNKGEMSDDPAIEVYDVDGNFRRHIGMTGFDDPEGICLYNQTSNLFAIVEEGSNHITVVNITTSTTTLAKSSGETMFMGLGRLRNLGIEGITYDASNHCFYAVKEQTPMAVYKATETGSSNLLTTVLFDAESVFGGVCTDLSDIHLDRKSGHLLIQSHEGRKTMECDLQGHILSILSDELNQPEGVLMSDDQSHLFIVGEPAQMVHYVLAPRSTALQEGGTLNLQVCLTETSPVPVSVEFFGTNGTATPWVDYAPATGVVVFAPGVLTQVVAISTYNDVYLEPSETFSMILTNAAGAYPDNDSAWNCTITDQGRFEWDSIPSPQSTGAAFQVRIVARGTNGVVQTGFTGTVAFTAATGDTNTVKVIGDGSGSWAYPMYSCSHDARTQVIYNRADIGVDCTFTGLALEVTAVAGQMLNNWTIRMKHTDQDSYSSSSEWETGWTTGYRATMSAGTTGWRTFLFTDSFVYASSSNLMVDFSFNNVFSSSPGYCRATTRSAAQSMCSYSDSTHGDPTTWAGTTPTPRLSTTTPNIRLLKVASPAVSIVPTMSGNFVDGIWTGDVAVLNVVTGLVVLAADGKGHTGFTAAFDVESEAVLRVSMPTNTAEGDGPSGCTVTITRAPPSDLQISLVSSDPSELTVPALVTITAGQHSASFDMTTADDADLDGTQSATITASAAGCSSGSGTNAVDDNEMAILSVVLPSSAIENDGVLVDAGRVCVSAAVAVDAPVELVSSDTATIVVPPSVTVPAGQTSTLFNVTIVDDGMIDGARVPWVSAKVPNWTDGSNTMTVFDNETTNLTVILPASGVEGSGPVTGRVNLSGTLLADLAVTLDSSDTSEATVTNETVIRAGQTSATFIVTIMEDVLIDGSQFATITAGANGFAAVNAGITVLDNELHHYQWGAIGASQTGAVPFLVTITALNLEDVQISTYTGRAYVGATGATGSLPVQPTNTSAFMSGQWTGSVTVLDADGGATLIASDGFGRTGTSTVFTIAAPPLAGFEWSPVDPLQGTNVPFAVAITAKNILGSTARDFSDSVTVSGVVDAVSVPVEPSVTAAFVDGVWTGMVTALGPATGMVLRADDGNGHAGESNPFDAGDPPFQLVLQTSGNGVVHKIRWFEYDGVPVVEVVAEPGQYWHFLDWGGDIDFCTISDATIHILMDQPRSITAFFAENLAAYDTPEWWLAQNELTNSDWNTEADGDTDGDRMPAWQEYRAGTCPTSFIDCLRITGWCFPGAIPDDAVVTWAGVSGRLYEVWSATDLVSGSWAPLTDPAATNAEGDGKPLSYTNNSPAIGSTFFHIRLKQ